MTDDESRSRQALQPGRELHWYRIEEVLGQGGFGITYLAYDANLARQVAIKEYLPLELAVRDADANVHPVSSAQAERYQWGLERFIVEARTLARFEHPAIVRVQSVFEANNTAYMVMEFQRGESLQQVLDRTRTLPEDKLIALLDPLLDGLAVIHEQGFIHRDIKPANIFVREDGQSVLLDFGSARQALGQHTQHLTSVVSPGYAPFEQYYSRGDRQGPWTDIYGLGATLYRCIAGIVPMAAIDRSEAILKTSRDMFVAASELGEGRYSPAFLAAIDSALVFDEEQRPRTVEAWRASFARSAPPPAQRALDAEAVTQAAGKTSESRAAMSVLNVDARSSRFDSRPSKSRTEPAKGTHWWGTLGIGVALLVGAVYWFAEESASPPLLLDVTPSPAQLAAPPERPEPPVRVESVVREPLATAKPIVDEEAQFVPELPSAPVAPATAQEQLAEIHTPPQVQLTEAPEVAESPVARTPELPAAPEDALSAEPVSLAPALLEGEPAAFVDAAIVATLPAPAVEVATEIPPTLPSDPPLTVVSEPHRGLAEEIANEEAALAAAPRAVIDFEGFDPSAASAALTTQAVLARIAPALRMAGIGVVSREDIAARGGDWRNLVLLIYGLEVQPGSEGVQVYTATLDVLGRGALGLELNEALAGERLWSRGQSGNGTVEELAEVVDDFDDMTRAYIDTRANQ